jgi:hypothetical protein
MRVIQTAVIFICAALVFGCVSGGTGTKKIDYGQYTDFVGKDKAGAKNDIVELSGDDEDFVGVSRINKKSVYGDAVVVIAGKKFDLGRSAGEKEMALFRKSLDAGYAGAMNRYLPLGFTYALSMIGTVNPLSTVEVQCMMSEQSAQDVGQQTCNFFFNEVKNNFLEAAPGDGTENAPI